MVLACEAPVADGTRERSLSGVLPHVPCEMGRPGRCVRTLVTAKSLGVTDIASDAHFRVSVILFFLCISSMADF